MDSIIPKRNDHFYVFTGGPGVGKTSVINYLQNKRIRCIKEAARSIIKDQSQTNAEALPWKNKNLYKKLMLNFSIKDYRRASCQENELTFFDRGIPDTLAYAYLEELSISKELRWYAQKYRYNTTVFVFPPWKEIYQTDNERKQQFDEVVRTNEIIIQTYQSCGYEPVIIPKTSVQHRTEFILHRAVK